MVSCGKGGRVGEGDVLNGGEVLALVEGRAARVLDFEALGLCVLRSQSRDQQAMIHRILDEFIPR